MPTPERGAEHVVHFYRDDNDLCAAVARFIVEGVDRGERAIVLATAKHWRAVCAALNESGHEVASGTALFMDAEGVLRDIMLDGRVNTQRFADTMAEVIAGVQPARVRIFGELVTLLAERGALDAALEIEQVGHRLSAAGCNILCAYDLYHLDNAKADAQRVAAVHDRTDPGLLKGRVGVKTILLADDYEDTRDLYREYLVANGYQVVTAESGHDAIRAAGSCQADLVLMDLRMPDMSGGEAMLTLRKDPRFKNVPIVAFTANAGEHTRVECLAAGFDAVIVKPCLPDELLEQIRHYLLTTSHVQPDAQRSHFV